MGPKNTGYIMALAAALLAGEFNGKDTYPPRKRSQKNRKRGFKARPKKGHK